MSEVEDYKSEFQAPVHSVVGRRQEGRKVITTVILGGEICEFEADISTVRSVGKIASQPEVQT